jgi:purine-cytosine permease-like protein
MAILQCASCVGWSAVNVTVGGQTLRSLSNNTLPTPVAIVILAVVTGFVSMVGYKYIS